MITEKGLKLDSIIKGHGDFSEILNYNELINKLDNRHIRSMWGVSVGKILHFGYDPIIVKQWSFLRANFDHTILIADLHTAIEEPKIENLEEKSRYTYTYFKDLCNMHGASISYGSSFQYHSEYTQLLYKLLSITPTKSLDKIRIANKQGTIGSLVYPMMQIADSAYLKADITYGGQNQRATYMVGREILPKLGLPKPVVLLSPMSKDIMGKELVKSTTATRITIHDTDETLKQKIGKMFAPQSIEDNPLLDSFRYSIIPWFKKINIDTIYGKISIKDYNQLCEIFLKNETDPYKLKLSAYFYLSQRLNKIRRYFDKKSYLIDWIDIGALNKKV
ncbi:MAG: hypothetical protein KGH65_02940 [Candidatus Micrarchaeota archaeon]|nr:hypothetical protein [Candidatus Micrarchaeota archaeon]